MKFRPAFAVLSMTLALTACGTNLPWEKKAAEPETPAHSGPPAVSPIDQPIETGTEGVVLSTAEAQTVATKMFRAAGQGWVATAGDNTTVYERPGQKSVGVTTRRMTYAKGVEFIGVMSGKPFSLNIQATECTDGAGEKHAFTARLSAAGSKLTGCASATDTMPKAQIKAAGATAKPKAAAAKPAAAKPAKPAEAVKPASDAATTPATPAPATTTPVTPSTATPATTPEATSVAPVTTPAETPAVTTPAAPVVTAPAVTAPVVTAPVVPAPVVTAPVVTAPVVTAPVVTAPAPVIVPTPSTTESTSGSTTN